MKLFYGVMCLFGLVLPYGSFVPWFADHGLAFSLLLDEAFASRIGAFAWWDVIVSGVALLGFIAVEGQRLGMARLWMPVVATLGVGVSLGLPLFLWMRESHLARSSAQGTP